MIRRLAPLALLLATFPAMADERTDQVAAWAGPALQTILSATHEDRTVPTPAARELMTEQGARKLERALDASGNVAMMRRDESRWRTDVSGVRPIDEASEGDARSYRMEARAREFFWNEADKELTRELTINFTVVDGKDATGTDGLRIEQVIAR